MIIIGFRYQRSSVSTVFAVTSISARTGHRRQISISLTAGFRSARVVAIYCDSIVDVRDQRKRGNSRVNKMRSRRR